eukprot:6205449-Pleurochrysis_carterae.AAC.2
MHIRMLLRSSASTQSLTRSYVHACQASIGRRARSRGHVPIKGCSTHRCRPHWPVVSERARAKRDHAVGGDAAALSATRRHNLAACGLEPRAPRRNPLHAYRGKPRVQVGLHSTVRRRQSKFGGSTNSPLC